MTRISYIFVPGHPGVRGNERADMLAGLAAVGNGHAMDRADILNAVRETRRLKDASHDGESATMSRLYDRKVKGYVARDEHYAGKQRRLVNQQRTGVITIHTLGDILNMGSEHLWSDRFDVR